MVTVWLGALSLLLCELRSLCLLQTSLFALARFDSCTKTILHTNTVAACSRFGLTVSNNIYRIVVFFVYIFTIQIVFFVRVFLFFFCL